MLYSTKMVTFPIRFSHPDDLVPASILRAAKNGGPDQASSAPRANDRRDDHQYQAPSILPIDVRSPRLGDAAGLRHLDPLYRLDQPDSLLVPISPLRTGLASVLPGGRRRRPVFVASAGDRLVGYAQFDVGSWDQRWYAVALGASVGVFEAEPVWESILTHAVRAAGLRGVKRLFARVPLTETVNQAFRRIGWNAYASEVLFAATDLPRRGGWNRSVRRQIPSDTWGIHQLYGAVVPRPVQDAEALTSHFWEVNGRRSTPRRVSQLSWVQTDGHQPIGYAAVRSRGGIHVIDLMCLPDRREILPDLLAAAISSLPDRSPQRVYCAVRGYQAEVATVLGASGFSSILEQDLLVKYTTARVLAPVTEAVEFHVEARESLPKRVPTFLQGRARDGSAD